MRRDRASAVIEPAPKTNRVEVFFLDSAGGPVFCTYHRPASNVETRGNVLVAMPFGEEMNRCRSMITLQARSFAEIGVGTLVVDLYGTGDSSGEYGDARWELWLENLGSGLDWLCTQPGSRLGVLGVRMGGILAARLALTQLRSNPALMLWQPIIDGKQFFTQFLRIRIAAQMLRNDLAKETTASLRQQLASGKSIEVGGYEIHPELAFAIEAENLESLTPASHCPFFWLEQRGSTSSSLSFGQKLHESWADRGTRSDVAFFDGPAFWQEQERAIAVNAVDLTTDWLRSRWS
jgi:exosortase A-associated hydrolase 2